MASSWTHAIGAVAVASAFIPQGVPPRVWLFIATAAAAPDVDALGRLWGGGDVAWLGGHRALTHSLSFAALCGALLTLTFWRALPDSPTRARTWLAGALAIASHGALDALTTYGEGIQFLAPFTERRYWAPWRPLGDGIVRDTIAFLAFYGVARTMIMRRGLPLPCILNPEFLRAAG